MSLIDDFTYELDGNKPPLGLRPRRVVDMDRAVEILEAMVRSLKTGKVPPGEWQGELMETMNRLRKDEVPLSGQPTKRRY